jgi:preprotein translocase subunit SecA
MDFAGYKEGEVIQHSMITKSIERAQRKVEENNFGIRKRLLEYDDVMNKQRTVIYTKRSHALFGERLALDLDNGFYSVAEGLISSFKEQADFEGFLMSVIVTFGIDTTITQEELSRSNEQQLAEKLYHEAITNYQLKKAEMAKNALPVFQNIRQQQGRQVENVVVPFTDGRRGMQVVANLQKTVESNGYELGQALERNVALGLIDDAWKEHLRAMDDLKQSVQTASYEQKDPLVIYKMEAFGLFKKLDEQVNRDIVSFLCHAGIPSEQEQPTEKIIHEARHQKTDMSKMSVNKDEIDSAGQDYATNENDYFDPTPTAVKQQPIVVGPKVGRNDPCPCGSGKKFKNCHGRDL